MKDTPEGFEFTEKGTMDVYLSVDISPLPDRKRFTLFQPILIYQMIQALGFDPNTTKGSANNTPYGYLLLNKELVQPKMSPKLSLSDMYLKSFIYCRNRTKSL